MTNVRDGRYGEQYVLSLVPTKHMLADEGTVERYTAPRPMLTGDALSGEAS